ncbi:hypothetical protein BS47DRAFT_1310054, partial [Hydnum rufescens UP504]
PPLIGNTPPPFLVVRPPLELPTSPNKPPLGIRPTPLKVIIPPPFNNPLG